MKKLLLLILSVTLAAGTVFAFSSCDKNGEKESTESESEEIETEANVAPASELGISVRDFGAKGDNETDDTEAIKAAAKEAKERGCAIVFPAGKYVISASYTFRVPVVMAPMGVLCPTDDKIVLTFDAYLDAGLCRIFSNAGKVVLRANTTSYPEWFGASTASTTDSTSGIQRAIDCFPNGYGKVEFAAGKYITSDTILISEKQSHLTLIGVARQSRELFPGIECSNTKNPVLYLHGASGGNAFDGGLEDVTVENLEFKRKTMGGVNTDTVLVENTLYTTFRCCGFGYSQNGLRAVNVNGLRLYTIHATVGADLPGKEVRGVFIDGSKRGSTGILIDDFLFYTYASPKAINIGYKDVNKAGSLGDSVGDRRIKNFECSGPCDYGIWMENSGGFCGDVSILEFSMDVIKNTGIYIKGPSAGLQDQVNITNAYLRLDNPSGGAAGIRITGYANASCANIHVENGAGQNQGILCTKVKGGTLTGCTFDCAPFARIISLMGCQNFAVTGNSCNQSGALVVSGCEKIVIVGNTMPQVPRPAVGSANMIENNLFR